MADPFVEATRLEQDDSELVAHAADQLRAGAAADLAGGVPRGRAYVRRLQALTIDRPALGIAVARALHLEHIVEDLLAGMTVEGVPGIGTDGTELAPTRRHRTRRRGALMLAASGLVLLAEAVAAGGVAAGLLYAWTAVGLGLFFVGGYLVMLRE
jgi:hypothetical protein